VVSNVRQLNVLLLIRTTIESLLNIRLNTLARNALKGKKRIEKNNEVRIGEEILG
jgi:hypothetical protein